jgi:hypothetical protein
MEGGGRAARHGSARAPGRVPQRIRPAGPIDGHGKGAEYRR